MENISLTPDDVALLQAYLDEIEELSTREPAGLTSEEWDEAWAQIQATGEIPEKYKDRIGVSDFPVRTVVVDGQEQPAPHGKTEKGYYDLARENFAKEIGEVNEKYRDPILKAINFTLTTNAEGGSVVDLLRELVEASHQGDTTLSLASLPSTTLARLKKITFPLDKVNRNIWALFEHTTGQQLRIASERMGDDRQVNILYSIDFDNLPPWLTISKKLEPYDKRVYMVVAALFNAGKTIVTYTEIYNNMGYTGRPGKNDLDKIDKAISKMGAAHIYLNNTDEIKAKYKYPRYVYDGALLPMERVRAIVNGQIAESAVRLFREPPLMTFARGRDQITTVTRKELESPLSKTDANLRLEDYLIEEIAGVKRGRRRNKFLYETVYEKTGITTTKQKQRAPEKIRKLLAHYVECGTIERCEFSKDGFTIYYASKGQNSDR